VTVKFVLAIGGRIPRAAPALAYEHALIFDYAPRIEDARVLAQHRSYDVLLVDQTEAGAKELDELTASRSPGQRVVWFHMAAGKWNYPPFEDSITVASANAVVRSIAHIVASHDQQLDCHGNQPAGAYNKRAAATSRN
jgi:hypothetical protein